MAANLTSSLSLMEAMRLVNDLLVRWDFIAQFFLSVSFSILFLSLLYFVISRVFTPALLKFGFCISCC